MLTTARSTLAIDDPLSSDAAYRASSTQSASAAILTEIAHISDAHSDAGFCLLCFEDVEKVGDVPCHRRSFARWWEEKTAQEVPELVEWN